VLSVSAIKEIFAMSTVRSLSLELLSRIKKQMEAEFFREFLNVTAMNKKQTARDSPLLEKLTVALRTELSPVVFRT
jgi:hypothetical protein